MKKIKQTLKRIKQQSKSSDKILVCPRCGSTRLRLSSRMDTWLTPTRYVCEDCGYIGPIVMEIEKEQLKKRKN